MKDARKHINQVANQHTEIVDNDAIWAGIQAKMDKPKKRRRIPPFFIWGTSFLIITLVGISLFKLTDKTTTNTPNIKHDVVTNINQDAFTKVNENTSTTVHPPLESKTPTHDQIKLDKIIDQDEIKKVKNQKKSIAEKHLNTIPSNYGKVSEINPESTDDSTHNSLTTQKDSKNIITSITPVIIPIQFSKERGIIILPKVSTSLNSLEFERSKLNIALEIQNSTPQLSEKDQALSFFNSLTLYTQYGTGSKSIQPDSNNTELRNQSEELLEQFRFGIESDLVNLLDFTLYGGVSYVSINYKVSSNETYYKNKEITYLKSISKLPDGTEIKNFATEDLPHHINQKSIRYNSNKLISMPFGIRFGREISKLQLSIGLGVDVNYGLSDEHTIVGKDGRLTNIAVGGKWFNPSLHSTITIEYPIYDRWYLHSKVMYRSINLNHTSIDYNWEEKYKLYGLDLGLKIVF